MPDPSLIALGLLVPLLAASFVFALAWRPWRRFPMPAGAWAAPVGLSAGYIAGQALIGWPPFPPIDSVDWLAWIAAGTAVVGPPAVLWLQLPGRREWLAWLMLAVLPAAAPWLVLRPLLAAEPPELTAAGLSGLAALFLLGSVGIEALSTRGPGPRLPLVLWIAAGGASASLAISGSLRLAQLAAALAAALGAALAMSLWRPTVSLAGGGSVVAAVLGGLLVAGCSYSDLPASSALLIALAPFAAWGGELGGIRRLGPWKSTLVCAVSALIAATAAAAIAWAASPGFEPSPM